MSQARQIQVVVWDETGTAVWSTAIALPAGAPTAEQAYEAAMQLAHVTELMLLDVGAQGAGAETSAIPTTFLRARTVS